jgi:signal transduction histidine kinase/CheY-like chemotaxis protein
MKAWLWALLIALEFLAMGAQAAEIREVSLGSAPKETMLLADMKFVIQPEHTDEEWGAQQAWDAVRQGLVFSLDAQRKPYRSNLVHWAVTRLSHQSSETDWVLYYRLAAMENMQVFARIEGGQWLPLKGLHHQTKFLTGYHFPSFALRMPRGLGVELAIRIQTRAPIDMHVLVVPGYHFYEAQRSDLVVSGMVVAVPLVVLMYLTLLLPKTTHLGVGWFIAMIALETLGSMWISGHGQVLLPMIERKDWPTVGYVSYSLLVIVSWLHGQRFVAAAPLGLGMRIAGWTLVALVASSTVIELMQWANARNVVPVGLLLFSCLMTAVGVRGMLYRIPYAGYYALAWFAFVMPAVILAMNLLGILSLSGSNIYYVQSSVAAILFGLVAVGHVRAREQALLQVQLERSELTQMKNKLEEALAVRLRFFAATNHDLRQPLQTMSIYLELALQQAKSLAHAEGLSAYLIEAKAAYSSVSHFLDSLLDLARIESKVLTAKPVEMDLVPMLMQLVREHQPLGGRVGLELRYVLPERAYAQTDPRLLERIVRNLLNNAIRYTQHGGVLLALRGSKNHWRIQVFDTGSGFKDTEMQRLFQPFASSDLLHSRPEAGSGLGLFVVKSLADALGHSITLKSRQNRGSCFTLALARCDPPNSVLRLPTSNPSENQLSGLLIWLLEDEPDVGQALLTMLKEVGANVVWMKSPHEIDAALIDAKNDEPHILIADFNLGQGGMLVEHLPTWRHKLLCPVVALTGSMHVVSQQSLDELHVHEVLAKPITIQALTQALLSALNSAAPHPHFTTHSNDLPGLS